MDARNLPPISPPASARIARAVTFILALILAWGLWRAYGAWLMAAHVD